MKKNKVILGCLSVVFFCSFKTLNNVKTILTDPTTIDGIFRVNKVIAENFRGQNLFTKYSVNAVFPTDTIGVSSFNNRKYGGTVNLNNTSLYYFNGLKFYTDTTIDLAGSNGFNWNIGGSDFVNQFNYVNTNGIPTFNYSSLLLPTTIDTSNDLTIQLSQISSADSVCITFSRVDSIARPPFIARHFGVEGHSFTIGKSLLQQYSAGQDVFISIAISNYSAQIISGKNYYFINTFEYRKKVTIVAAP